MKKRVAVMSPQTRLALHRRRVGRADASWRRPKLDPAAAERAETFYRRQRSRAITALALLFALVFGLPVVFAALPGLDGVRLAGIPLSWLMLAALPYGAMVVLARWQLRRAEAAEEGPAEEPPVPLLPVDLPSTTGAKPVGATELPRIEVKP
jgi:hypothetical protein